MPTSLTLQEITDGQGIARKGHYGSFLLPDYERIEEIAKALGSDDVPIPFTVKIRLLPQLKDTIALCQMLEREGAQLITVSVYEPTYSQVHGRTREQNKENVGECNWKAIQRIRESLSIPVVANGGVSCLSDANRCMKEIGVSGVMVGEAILENPALFVNGIDPADGHNLTVVGN